MDQNLNPAVAPTEKKGLPKNALIFGGIGLFVALIILVIILLPKGSGGSKAASEIFSEDILIAVKKDGKYGYIDLDGNMKIEPQFKSAYDFTGDYAVALTDDNKVLIDKKGEVKITAKSFSDMDYNNETGIWYIDHQLYDKKLNKILDDDWEVYSEESGYYLVAPSDYNAEGFKLYNKNGKAVYESKTGDDRFIDVAKNYEDFENAYCALGDNVIVNCDTGKVIKDNITQGVTDDDVTSFKFYNNNYDTTGYILIAKDKIVWESDSDDVDIFLQNTSDGKYYYKIYDDANNKTYYYDFTTDSISENAPTSNNADSMDRDSLSSWELASSYTIISSNGNFGLASGTKEVVTAEYRHIRTPDVTTYEFLKNKGKESIIGNKEEKSYVLSPKNGKTIQEIACENLDYEELSSFTACKDYENNKYIVYNLVSDKLQEIETDSIDYSPMYIKTYSYETKQYSYYNKDFKLIFTEER